MEYKTYIVGEYISNRLNSEGHLIIPSLCFDQSCD